MQPGYPGPMPGADPSLPHVLTPEQVCAGKRPPGPRVVVYDADGYYVAPGVAELLAADGYEVTVVTTFAVLSPVSDQTLEGDMLRAHLHRAGVGSLTRPRSPRSSRAPVTAAATAAEWAVAGHDRHGEPWSAGCDGVVLVTQQASDDALYRELAGDPEALAAAGIAAVYRIGDAVAPRLLSEAVFDGHRLAREIDSPDPATPLPYRPRAHRTRLGVSCPRRGGRPAEPTVTSGRGCSRWAVSLKPRTIHRGPRSPPGGRWIRCPR